ncbi:hypothetical protein GCM10007880_03910 [Mesorhizobium amorphae]|nr:hypothetical protein GCM10007880_03910 [Mesorhizobium amorphae]
MRSLFFTVLKIRDAKDYLGKRRNTCRDFLGNDHGAADPGGADIGGANILRATLRVTFQPDARMDEHAFDRGIGVSGPYAPMLAILSIGDTYEHGRVTKYSA